jgi:hypothetical protein
MRRCAMSAKTLESRKAKRERRIVPLDLHLSLAAADFKEGMGCWPKNQQEFDAWANAVKKRLFDGHIDWELLYELARDRMRAG